MSLFTDAAIRLLRGEDYTVYAPGDEPKALLKDEMVDLLAGAGFTVLPPGVCVAQAARNMGLVVLQRSEKPPAIGNWVPKDKANSLRIVLETDGASVLYRQDGDLRRHTVGAFHKWRRRNKAVLVRITPGPAQPSVSEKEQHSGEPS